MQADEASELKIEPYRIYISKKYCKKNNIIVKPIAPPAFDQNLKYYNGQ